MKRTGLALLLALPGLALQPAMAAESLAQAWARALERDPGLAAAEADQQSAEARARAARAARLPTVEVGASYTRYDTAPSLAVTTPTFAFTSPPLFDGDDALMGDARITLPLYTGGMLSASVRAATQGARAAQAGARQSRSDLKLDVAARYAMVLRARRALAAAEASVTSLAAHTSDVEAMVGRELVATSDLLSARVALANAEQLRLRAANGLDLAHAGYNRLLGEPLDRVPELDERGVDNGLAPEARTLDDLVTAALQTRGDLESLDARAGELEAAARAERGRLLPQLSLVGAWNHLETTVLDREDFTTIGVGVRWTLFDGGQVRQRAAAIARTGRAARLRLDDLRSRIGLEVREAWLGVAEADARRGAAREAVAQADENLRISRELYGAGLVSNTQVLEAVSLRIAAAGNRDDSTLDAELARLRLARATGEL